MKYVRKGKNITEINDEGEIVSAIQLTSVSKAKKESWKIQMENDGGLGRGSVRLPE